MEKPRKYSVERVKLLLLPLPDGEPGTKTKEGNYGDEGVARKRSKARAGVGDQPAGVRICHFGPRTRPRKLVLLHPSTMLAAVLAADDDSSLILRILPPGLWCQSQTTSRRQW